MTREPRPAVPAPGADSVYDDPNCEHCGDPWDEEPIEHVDGRGPGWKCMTCQWWNWLPKRGGVS